ncbi:MAG TPA: GGDEF domain-containing protein, partial [Pseudomonadota bacterium]|nr:GGDEF domain-containing protein [Pseudomonadota bacterium]
ERGAAYPLGAYGSSLRIVRDGVSAFSSVLCVLPPCLGFCCVWYRLRRLEDRSSRDYQTGLRSGRLFDDDAAMLCRSSAAVAVLLVDLDNFRRFNQAGYREEGDRALLTAAQVLKENLRRQADRLYRMHTAGDEFLILLTVDSFREAHRQAERLRVALERAALPACIGIAFADASGSREPARLLRLATINKDTAKKSGGNAVFPPEEPPTASAPLVVSHALPVGLAVSAAAARLSADVPPVDRRNHPSECMCALCLQDVRQVADAAQVQTLGLFDDMGQIRRRLRDVRESLLNTADDISSICDGISHHIGAGPTP